MDIESPSGIIQGVEGSGCASGKLSRSHKPTDHLSLRSTSNLQQLAAALTTKLSTSQRLVIVCPGCEPNWNTENGVEELFTALSKLPELTEIKLNCLGLLDVAFPVRLLTRLLQSPNLMGLELDDVTLSATREDLLELSEVIRQHPSLQEFRLFGCLAEDTVESESLDALLTSLSTLERVEIDAVDDGLLGNIQGSTLGIVGRSNTLQKFHLNGFALDNECLGCLAEALAINTSLEDLSFDLYSGTPGFGAFALCDSLRANSHLLRLHISISHSWNQDNFLMAMAQSLTTHCTLKSLIIGAISVISDTTARSFAEMLVANTVMELLQLSRYKGDWKPTLHYYLKLNSQGRGHFLQHFEKIPRGEWVEALVKAKEDVDGHFYFLQLNPLLCSTAATTTRMDDSCATTTAASTMDDTSCATTISATTQGF